MRTARRYYKAFQRNIRYADTKIKLSVFIAKCKESLEDLNKMLVVKLKDSDPEFVSIIKNMVKLEKEIISGLEDIYNNYDKMLQDVKEDKIKQLKEQHQELVDAADKFLVEGETQQEPAGVVEAFGFVPFGCDITGTMCYSGLNTKIEN